MMTNGRTRMCWSVFALLALCPSVLLLFAQKDEEKCLATSAAALQKILFQENGLPNAILDKGYCVIIFPGVKKVAVTPGGRYGKGALVCRQGSEMDGAWGAPVMYALDMPSVRFQIGTAETDFVLIIASQKGALRILSSKTKLGSNVAMAVGPTGAQAASYKVGANTDILTYARLDGPFSGVSLAGASMDNDEGANKAIYGKNERTTDIALSKQSVVPAAKPLVDLLNKVSPTRR
jgi:lipid-binding SYLF domain-containing protein